jgi:hypothetical protein
MTLRTSSILAAALLAPLPALAQFDCAPGDRIRLTILPRPHGGVDYCVPDVDTPLLCTNEGALVRWRVDSTCQGEHTVAIVGDGWKANATAPVTCHPDTQYPGPVSGDETSLTCPLPTAGKYGYRIVVCRPGGHCASTDPGIWVNRPATQAEYEAAAAEARKLTFGTEALLKPREGKAPKKGGTKP